MRRCFSSTVTRLASVGCAVITGRTRRAHTRARTCSAGTPAAAAAAITWAKVPRTCSGPRSTSRWRRWRIAAFCSAIERSWNQVPCAWIARPTTPAGAPAGVVGRAIQAQGTWFQLLSIAEQNAAMRQRRQSEVERGPDQVRGTFAQVIAAAAAAGVPAEQVRALVCALRVRPVITAHPTEAKRVTVLEKHRRIYRRLVDLESPRWTPRERQALIDGLRNEIELLWSTGELRLVKPTVPQEVFWGLHFFNETLFEAIPDLLDKLERAL